MPQTKPFINAAAQIDNVLSQAGSPMAGMGSHFIQVAKKYAPRGTQPEFLAKLVASITKIETSYGTAGRGPDFYNAWGWMQSEGGQMPFSSWKEGIRHVTQGIAENYIGQGLQTPLEIARKYAPAAAGNNPEHWAQVVSQSLKDMGSVTPQVNTQYAEDMGELMTQYPEFQGDGTVPVMQPRSVMTGFDVSETPPNIRGLMERGRQTLEEGAQPRPLQTPQSFQERYPVFASLTGRTSFADPGFDLGAPTTSSQPAGPLNPISPLGDPQNLPVVTDTDLPDADVQEVLGMAHQYLGVKYVFGSALGRSTFTTDPSQVKSIGFDCSGFISYLISNATNGRVKVTPYTGAMVKEGKKVPTKISALRPGDAVFFGSDFGHVGLYVGKGKFIHAPKTGDVVKISDINSDYYKSNLTAVRRYVDHNPLAAGGKGKKGKKK